jgi:hypothetical protein
MHTQKGAADMTQTQMMTAIASTVALTTNTESYENMKEAEESTGNLK